MLALAAQNRLPPPDNEIVQQHAADHHGNHAEIELADPAYSDAADIGGERCVDVHLTNDEFLADTRVTLRNSSLVRCTSTHRSPPMSAASLYAGSASSISA